MKKAIKFLLILLMFAAIVLSLVIMFPKKCARVWITVTGKPKNVAIRLYLYGLFGLFLATGGLSMFVLFPLYKQAFAPRAKLSELPVFKLWAHIYKVIWRSVTDGAYRKMYPSEITDPPKLNTDRSLVEIKPTWAGEDGNCDACENTCCGRLKCPLFGENGRCLGYDSIFFNYFYCGRYPENQAQIDYYDCPKWQLKE
ncbi:MAG: hypothetical protein FWG65_03430 [Turicibacter sp.]|nr:hypothetical protein [Turicibacter sp.]